MAETRIHTTNYYSTFIEVAEDCPATAAEIPPEKAGRTLARIQYDLLASRPYSLTSDDVVFGAWAEKNAVAAKDRKAAREAFFSKGQPCLRSSPLAKRYGFGIHLDAEGRAALVPLGAAEYRNLLKEKGVKKVKAMRSRRK